MFGIEGTTGAAGAGPRPAGTMLQRKPVESSSQLHPPPRPLMPRSTTVVTPPVATSATSSRMVFAAVCVMAIFLPSGEKLAPNDPSAGSANLRSVPVATSFNVRPMVPLSTWLPLVRGLMRDPPRRNIGDATSASVGMLRRCVISIVFRSGDNATPGNGSASMMSTMTFGGVR